MKEHRKNKSLFQLIDQKKFDQLSEKWQMDKGVRSFSTREMTQALVSCFVLRLGSYREVEGVLGIPDSTFGDALRTRSSGFFKELCDMILHEIRGRTESRKIKKAIKQILAIDSSECKVHGSLFSFSSWRQKCSNGKKASLKFHVVWNVNNEWIDDFEITGGRRNDLTVAKTFSLLKNKIYVFDRAYVDLKFWLKIIKSGSDFVTRLKRAPRKEEIHKYILTKDDLEKNGVLWQGNWTPSEAVCYRNDIKPKQLKLRHVIYRDAVSRKIFDFITSNWKLSGEDIADIYKKRWSVELLFRWLKGHLNIRYFAVRNKNAVKVQLAVAVLVQLLLRLKRVIEQFTGSLWELLREIRTALIQKSLAGSSSAGRVRRSSAPRAPLRPPT